MKIWHPRHPTPAMQSASGLAGMGWRGRWTIRTGRPTPGSLACKKVVCTCKNRASASTLPHGSLIVRARRNKSESDVTHRVFFACKKPGFCKYFASRILDRPGQKKHERKRCRTLFYLRTKDEDVASTLLQGSSIFRARRTRLGACHCAS